MKLWNSGNVRTSDLGLQTSEVRSRKSEVLRLVALLTLFTFSHYGEAAQVEVDNQCKSLKVSGETALTGAGGVILSSLSIPADAKLVLDPIATPICSSSTPTFGKGAKIALSSDYKGMKLGCIVLLTYSGTATFDQSLFDATSVAPGATCKLTQETAPGGKNKQLVLTVGDYAHKAKDITVALIGDSLTQGVKDRARGDCPQYRTAVAARLAAAGFRPKFVGIWKKSDLDAAGVRQPDDWTSHTGIAGAAIVATKKSVGFADNMPRYLDTAGCPDVITLCIGSNDFIMNNKDVAETFRNFVALVNAISAKRPNANIIGTTLPPVPNNQGATHKALAFDNLLTSEYAKPGHGELPDNFCLLDFVARLQNLVQSGKVPRDLKGYCARDAHPNWRGHDLIARAFAEKISEVCPFVVMVEHARQAY